jgi:uncharacterized LabA/DUF88 family protein
MKRAVICVDAGYLFAQGSVALTGIKQRPEFLVLDAAKVISELAQVATARASGTGLLRIYWYDGALGLRPTVEQEQIGHLENVKVRLGFINSFGQQKGVDSLIVTDLIELARLGAICDAVLLSGDEDVRVGVQIAQNYGVRVHLLGIHPSRGSQSKALLQEADTTSEWDTATVEKFLSMRSVPALDPTTASTAVTSPPPGVTAPAPPAASSVVASTVATQLQGSAETFAGSLAEGDIKSLIAHWTTQRGLPREFDGRLLAKSRAAIGRELDMQEKRFAREKFSDAVRARALGAA